jgi:hypothetical protein
LLKVRPQIRQVTLPSGKKAIEDGGSPKSESKHCNDDDDDDGPAEKAKISIVFSRLWKI